MTRPSTGTWTVGTPDAIVGRAIAVFAAITAAGASTRMGAPKSLLLWNGRTLLATMIDSLRRAGLAAPAVVVGADRERVSAEARRLGAEPLWNAHYRDGRFTSVRVAARWAIDRAASRGCRPALLLWPVDCPAVAADTLAALCCAAATVPGANIAPEFRGRAGHPVILCADTLADVVVAPDDANLRELILRAPQGRRLVDLPDPAVLDNLNTAAEYEVFIRARSGAASDV